MSRCGSMRVPRTTSATPSPNAAPATRSTSSAAASASAFDRSVEAWRPAVVPVGGLLIGPADAQGGGFVIAAADDLQRQRQSGRGKAVGHGQRAQFERIDET